MKGKIAAIKGRLAGIFAILARTGASLPGTNIKAPVRTAQDEKRSQYESDKS